MPRYIVERTFPEGLHIPVAADGAELCRTLTERNAEEYVTWVHSYVNDDKRRTFCVYDAPSPEAIRMAAARNDRPVDRVTRVQVLDPYFYMGGVYDAQIIKGRNNKILATTGTFISTTDVARLSLGGGSGLAEAGACSSYCCRDAQFGAGDRDAAAHFARECPNFFLRRPCDRRPDRPCHRVCGVDRLWQGAGRRLR